jgi:hypothetical protein
MKASSYTVDRLPTRTVAPHGVTGAELRRFDGACHQIQRATRSHGELWWLTTPKGSTRHEIAAFQKRITRGQAACGLPQYSVWIFESRSKLHAHILFVGNRNVADALRRSRLCLAAKIEPVTNLEGLKQYLAKERTPQAGYKRRDLGGRIPGSHRLPGGGDRVRLSRQLERDAVEAGLVQPWKHTNAKRSAQRKDYRPRRLSHMVERQGDPPDGPPNDHGRLAGSLDRHWGVGNTVTAEIGDWLGAAAELHVVVRPSGPRSSIDIASWSGSFGAIEGDF